VTEALGVLFVLRSNDLLGVSLCSLVEENEHGSLAKIGNCGNASSAENM
jgi:hypothetical protein